MLMTKRQFLIGVRLFVSILTLIALGVQLAYLNQNGALNAVNFFSYFTNLSNIFASFVFILSALYLLKRRKPSKMDDIIRGASVLYMAVTGAVYVTLLVNEDLGLLLPWVNAQIHYVMPVAVVLDWLYQPQRSKLGLSQIWLWLIFPAVYLVYSLVRGAQVGWYPYPFLDPDKVGGYEGVAVFCIGILAVLFGFSWSLMKLGNRLKRNVA
jgi:hypothetical protein